MSVNTTTGALVVAHMLGAMETVPERLATFEQTQQAILAALEQLKAALPPLLVKVPEAADLMKVSVATMRRWTQNGAVPVVKVGNTVRVDMSKLRGIDELETARLARSAGRKVG